MSDSINKSKVLGSSTFNFIANLASRSTTSNDIIKSDIDFSSDSCSGVAVEDSEIITESSALTASKNSALEALSELQVKETATNPNFKAVSISDREFGKDNFLKGCKWSPDGTCILTCSDDSVLRLFDTNAQMLNTECCDEIVPSLKLVEPEIIYDYVWYPFMDSTDPATACVFSTCKDNPVHLFDAFTGHVRCSYKGRLFECAFYLNGQI